MTTRKQNLQNKIQNIKNQDGIDETPTSIVRKFKSQDPTILKAIKDLNQSLSKQINVVDRKYNKAFKQIAYEKASKAFNEDIHTLEGLKIALEKAGLTPEEVNSIPNKTLYKLIALDDWATVWNIAKPLLLQYGPKVLSWAYDKLMKKKDIGGDEGFNSADWGGILGPRRQSLMPGVNVEYPGVKDTSSYAYGATLVSGKALRSMICPELYKHRYAYVEVQRTALSTPVVEYSLKTNAAGAVGFAVSPGQVIAGYFASMWNAADFDPTTGLQTGSPLYYAGPLFNNAAIETCRAVNFSVQVIPNASFNSAGAFSFGYQPRTNQLITNADMGVTISTIKNLNYQTTFNNKTSARMIYVGTDPMFDNLSAVGNNSGVFYLIGSGLPISTEVARIVVTGTVEFIPTRAYLSICPLDNPSVGPMTEQFESLILTRHPVIQSLDLIDAKRVAEALDDDTMGYDEAAIRIEAALGGIPIRQYVPHFNGDARAGAISSQTGLATNQTLTNQTLNLGPNQNWNPGMNPNSSFEIITGPRQSSIW